MAILDHIFTDELTCKLSMSIVYKQGYNDTFNAVDMGISNDSYETQTGFITKDTDILDSRESNTSVTILKSSGFFPFGTHFLNDVEAYDYPVYQGRANEGGGYHGYTTTLAPSSSSEYLYVAPVWNSSKATGFSFGVAENFPVPSFSPSDIYEISSARSGSTTREYDRGISTISRRTRLSWTDLSGDDFAFLMSYIITLVRTTVFALDFDDTILRLAPWKQREGEEAETIFNVKLSSNEINFSCRDGNLWSVEIEVMKWQE